MKRIIIFFNLFVTLQIFSFDFDQDFGEEKEKKEKVELRGSEDIDLAGKSKEEQIDFYSRKVAEMLNATKDERDHEAMLENLQSEVTFNQPKTPLSAFSDGVKFLPQDIRREAWAHYEQAENTKQIETVKDAQNLAKMYQDKAMANDSKNSKDNTNTDSGCVIN